MFPSFNINFPPACPRQHLDLTCLALRRLWVHRVCWDALFSSQYGSISSRLCPKKIILWCTWCTPYRISFKIFMETTNHPIERKLISISFGHWRGEATEIQESEGTQLRNCVYMRPQKNMICVRLYEW